MPKSRFTRCVSVAAAVALFGASACSVSPTKRESLSYSLSSNPSGAQAITDKGENLGVTPLQVDQEYERRQVEASGWPYLLASAGLLVLGGSAIASLGDSESTEALPLVGGTVSLVTGFVAFGVGFASSMGAFDATQVRPVGSAQWTNLDKDAKDHQIAEALLGSVRLRSPGYRDQLINVQNGGQFQVTMVPGQSGAGAVAARPASNSQGLLKSLAKAKQQAAPKSATQSEPKPTAIDVKSGQQANNSAHAKPSLPKFVAASPQPTAFALVVGIENYRDISAPNGARADAERFAKMLQESMGVPQKNIRLLTDQKATRSDILAQANWLKKNVPPGGRIYFYFSGHGSPDVETGQSYILPYEASPELLKDTGVQLSNVLGRLGKSEAREVLAFVDSCFSGSGGRSLLPEGTRPLVPVKQVAKKPKVALFSAADASQISGNVPGENAGLFTNYVLEGLGKGKADGDGNGQVTLAELGSYVQPRVERVAKQNSRDQTPKLSMDDKLGEPEHIIVTWGLPLD